MAKREYRKNSNAQQTIPQPVEAEAPTKETPKTSKKSTGAPAKTPTQPTKAELAGNGGQRPPRKGTPREDATPLRSDALRVVLLNAVNGIVDAVDDVFCRLNAHEERLDEHDRQFGVVHDRIGAVEGRLTTLEEERPAPQPTRQIDGGNITINNANGGTVNINGGNMHLE